MFRSQFKVERPWAFLQSGRLAISIFQVADIIALTTLTVRRMIDGGFVLSANGPPMVSVIRPGTIVALAAGVVLTGACLLLWPADPTLANRAIPRALGEADDEIVWLNPATSSVAWERFVTAIRRLLGDASLSDVSVAGVSSPFPQQSAAVPELALTLPGRRKLFFRWYKLTSDLGASEWIEALVRRSRPPLAVIGGGSSDRARDLAVALNAARSRFVCPPLLLITTATADRLGANENLMDIYRDKSFRYCFTNRQMAAAIADFLWSREDLRPDAAPVYLTIWNDDPYSHDLAEQFHETLGPEGWGRPWNASRTAENAAPFWSESFPYSVGAFSEPTRAEAEGAGHLIDELAQHPNQHRPLLVLPATAQPARRFLRALLREAPADAQRFVIATGDAIDFNTIYRDRNLMWPIQDFPVPLVFFCHRNPVDPAAFTPAESSAPPDPMARTSTGTHDLLLYRDIAGSLIRAVKAFTGPSANADELVGLLRKREVAGVRFTESGDQVSGSGEYIVCLRPELSGGRIWPRARLQVWTRQNGAVPWSSVPIDNQAELTVEYALTAMPAATGGPD